MPARIGVVTFPGTLDDQQALRAAAAVGAEPVKLWHRDKDLHQVEAVIPIKNVDGRFVADERTLDSLEAEGRVLARYVSDDNQHNAGNNQHSVGNPNGSLRDIAGICNAAGNVVGLMPHPEYAIDDLT